MSADGWPISHALQCHPASPRNQIGPIAVTVSRSAAELTLCYRVHNQALVKWPKRRAAARADEPRVDELWRHTCAELFLACHEQQGAQDAYFEFNFSPSGEWAAYRFDAYRAGMQPAAVSAPFIVFEAHDNEVRIEVKLTLPEVLAHAAALQAGPCMVIEDLQGQCSYWALAHGAEHPDFHRRDGFMLTI